MKNLKDFTNAEFLSFLYSEKSREIENNAVPGWNKWAIYGALVTIIIFLYQNFTNKYAIYNYKTISIYIIGLIAISFCILIYNRLNTDVKTYMYDKVRPLKEEAPILLYVYQLIVCISAATTQFIYIGPNIIFFSLLIALAINSFILAYIIINRNKFVLAKLKIQVFNNWKFDNIIHSFLGSIYVNIIVFTIINLKKEQMVFSPSEFEIAIELISLIILIYWLLLINKKNNGIAYELDRLINNFVIGSISKDEAYKKYILIMYGLSAYQAIEKDLEIINNIKSNYDNKINNINDIKKRIESNTISSSDIKTLKAELDYYKKSNSSFSKLLNKITAITKLGIPAIVDLEFQNMYKEYETACDLLTKLIEQTRYILKEFDNQIYCKKYGGLCLNKECSHRNDRMLLKHKIQIRIQYIFHHTKQICINNKNHDI